MNRCLLLISLLLTQNFLAKAQENESSSCQKSLDSAFKDENSYMFKAFNDSLGWHLKYSMTAYVLSEENRRYERVDSKVDLTAGAHFRIKKTNDVEIYADKSNVISINKKSKRILRTVSTPEDIMVHDPATVHAMQDTLLKLMNVVDCTKSKIEGHDLISYHLKSNKLRCPYRTATIHFDAKSRSLYKMDIEMNLAYQNQLKSYSFTVIERNYVKPLPTWTNIHSMFFVKDGVLQPAYSQYQLSDLTKNSRKKNQ